MIQKAVAALVEGRDLSFEQARDAMGDIFSGQVTPAMTSALLVALRMKGESADEIAGAAQAMRSAATRLTLTDLPVVVDTCGTGGDGRGSFNISTAAALVVAGAGFPVAKHGNRSVSSVCGSADVLEALGVKIDVPPALVERCVREAGMGFLFAPGFHPAMKHAMPVRRELGIRTVFNILGPLTNPAGATAQVIGVYSKNMLETIGRVLVRLGLRHGWVVHGSGHDEIVLSGKTDAMEILNGRLKRRELTPRDFGLPRRPAASLRGGDAAANASIIRRVLAGESGPARDAVVANAAAAVHVAARAAGRRGVETLARAAELAQEAIDSGAAQKTLDTLVAISNGGR